MSYRIVRIVRSPADDRLFESAEEALDEMHLLWIADTTPGVEYAIAHDSYPLAP